MNGDKQTSVAPSGDGASSTAVWPYALPQDDPRQGTTNGYRNLGCRCSACRDAHTRDFRDRGYGKDTCACGKTKVVRARRCGQCRHEEDAPDHGTEGKYQGGCRCGACREASAAGRRKRRQAHLVPCIDCGTLTSPPNDSGRRGASRGLARCQRCAVLRGTPEAAEPLTPDPDSPGVRAGGGTDG